MDDHLIITVEEVLLCGAGRRFHGGNDLGIVRLAIGVGGFILEDNQKSTGDGLTGTDSLDQIVVVTLEFTALLIGLPFHIMLQGTQMLADVSPFGENFDLDFDGADLQPASIGSNDVLLLPHAA